MSATLSKLIIFHSHQQETRNDPPGDHLAIDLEVDDGIATFNFWHRGIW